MKTSILLPFLSSAKHTIANTLSNTAIKTETIERKDQRCNSLVSNTRNIRLSKQYGRTDTTQKTAAYASVLHAYHSPVSRRPCPAEHEHPIRKLTTKNNKRCEHSDVQLSSDLDQSSIILAQGGAQGGLCKRQLPPRRRIKSLSWVQYTVRTYTRLKNAYCLFLVSPTSLTYEYAKSQCLWFTYNKPASVCLGFASVESDLLSSR